MTDRPAPEAPMKPIDELSRTELAAEFRAVIAEARRCGVTTDAGLIADWYALRKSRNEPRAVPSPEPSGEEASE